GVLADDRLERRRVRAAEALLLEHRMDAALLRADEPLLQRHGRREAEREHLLGEGGEVRGRQLVEEMDRRARIEERLVGVLPRLEEELADESDRRETILRREVRRLAEAGIETNADDAEIREA